MSNWPALNPRLIADECSPAHIANVLTDAKAMIAEAALQLQKAESFIAGFEGDELEDGIDDLLGGIRAAIAKAKGGAQ